MKTTDTNDTAHGESSSLLDELWRAWETGFDEGAAFYSDDSRTRIWDGTAVDGPGREAYAAAGRGACVEDVAELKIDGGHDLRVLKAGDPAVTVTTLHNTGRLKGGGSFEERMCETLVWAPDGDGSWRIVHEHTSPVSEGHAD